MTSTFPTPIVCPWNFRQQCKRRLKLLVLINIKPYLKRIQCNDKFGENGRAVDGKI